MKTITIKSTLPGSSPPGQTTNQMILLAVKQKSDFITFYILSWLSFQNKRADTSLMKSHF